MTRRPRGFTLVEMVVVIALMGLMTAAAAPALRRLGPDDPLTRAAEQWAAVLRGARTEALLRNVSVAVLLDPGTGGYWTERGDSVTHARLALAPDVTVSGPDLRVRWTFNPVGSGGHGVAVSLHRGADVRVVDTDPWTGEVRVRIP